MAPPRKIEVHKYTPTEFELVDTAAGIHRRREQRDKTDRMQREGKERMRKRRSY